MPKTESKPSKSERAFNRPPPDAMERLSKSLDGAASQPGVDMGRTPKNSILREETKSNKNTPVMGTCDIGDLMGEKKPKPKEYKSGAKARPKAKAKSGRGKIRR